MKGIQRNFKVQETVQVKELEESLEKIKTQMEEARRARRQVCLRDLAGSCACFCLGKLRYDNIYGSAYQDIKHGHD